MIARILSLKLQSDKIVYCFAGSKVRNFKINGLGIFLVNFYKPHGICN